MPVTTDPFTGVFEADRIRRSSSRSGPMEASTIRASFGDVAAGLIAACMQTDVGPDCPLPLRPFVV